MRELDDFYLNLQEPIKGTMIALRDIILKKDTAITPEWKYKLPFFYYKGKMFCYLWTHKKLKKVYIGFVNGDYLEESFLIQEKRKKMKIMLFDPEEDLPVEKIDMVLDKAINLYKTGIVKI